MERRIAMLTESRGTVKDYRAELDAAFAREKKLQEMVTTLLEQHAVDRKAHEDLQALLHR